MFTHACRCEEAKLEALRMTQRGHSLLHGKVETVLPLAAKTDGLNIESAEMLPGKNVHESSVP